MRPRTVFGALLALLGLCTAFAEFALHWLAETRRPPQHYDIDPWVAFGGTVVAFVGGAMLDFSRAKDIGGFVVTSGVTILGALPFGRRWTDKVAAATTANATVVPAAPAAEGVGASPAPAQPAAIPDPYEDK